LGEIKDSVKDQPVELQLAFSGRIPGSGQDIFWGDPSRNYPIAALSFMDMGPPPGMYRGRLAFVGPNGAEQHYYFFLVRFPLQPLAIIPEKQSWWVADWEKQ
jgi:hypothetical protein